MFLMAEKSIKLAFLRAVLRSKNVCLPHRVSCQIWIDFKMTVRMWPKNLYPFIINHFIADLYVRYVLKSEADGFVTLEPHCTMLGWVSFCFLSSLSRLCPSSPQSDAQVKLLLFFPVAIFPWANALHQWFQGEFKV